MPNVADSAADVLVVDDEDAIRRLLRIALELEGYSVAEAGDGAGALRVLEQAPPRCVVLDVTMPSVGGFEVLRARRQRRLAPDSRFVIVTGKSEENDFLQGYELGAVSYITKPFSPELVVRRVGEVLAASPRELEAQRDAELRKAQLLRRMERAFARRPPPA